MKMSCMKFTRSSSAFASFDCRLGHREQLNLMTHYLDLTTVYGPNESRARSLRLLQGGTCNSQILFAVVSVCKNHSILKDY